MRPERPFDTAVWIKRVLERGNHQDAGFLAEDVLGPVAVVDIEVDDRDPFEPVMLQCMRGADRHVVEQAEPHGPIAARVVSRRAHIAEGVLDFAPHYEIGGMHDGACRAEGGLKRMWIHCGIGIELHPSLARCDVREGVDVVIAVDPPSCPRVASGAS